MVRFWVRFESEATGFTDGLGLMGEKKKDHSAASCGTEGERALPGKGKGGDQKLGLEHDKRGASIRHLSRSIRQVIGYLSLEFRRGAWTARYFKFGSLR